MKRRQQQLGVVGRVGVDLEVEDERRRQPVAPAVGRELLAVVADRTFVGGDPEVSGAVLGEIVDRRRLEAVVDADRFAALVRDARDAPPGRALPLLDEALGGEAEHEGLRGPLVR